MRRNWGDSQEEWLIGSSGVSQEVVGLLGNEVGRILSQMVLGRLVVPLEGRVPIIVRVGVEEEILRKADMVSVLLWNAEWVDALCR